MESGGLKQRPSGRQPLAAAGVEQVSALQIRLQADGAAGRKVVALAEHRGQVHAVVAASDEGVHAGGLHHDDLHRDAAGVSQRHVLGSGAENHRLTVCA